MSNSNEIEFLLPPLVKKTKLTAPTREGEWIAVSSDTLGEISDALNSQAAFPSTDLIPDIWARAILFETALFDRNHPLHSRIKGEWRGFLALLALKEMTRIVNLRAVPINLDPAAIDHPDPNSPAPHIFHSILLKLLPKTQVYPQTGWNNLYVFLIDNQPIAITTPITLIATSAEYSSLKLKTTQISWYDQQRLKDPVSGLSLPEKEGLDFWLSELHSKLTEESPISGNEIRKNELLTLIEEYREELKISEPAGTLTEIGLGLEDEAGVFRLLDKTVLEPVKESNVRLVSKEVSTPILIVDKKIIKQWFDKESKDVIIQGAFALKNIPVGYEKLPLSENRNKIGDRHFNKVEVWNPQHFFTEKLYYTNENAFPGTIPINCVKSLTIDNNPISVILPLRKELLSHLASSDLAGMIKFVQIESTKSIKVTLTVELSGFEEEEKYRDYKIEKTYSLENMQKIPQIPILEIFPNFNSEQWKSYYVAYSTERLNETFQITPFGIDQDPTILPVNSQGKRCLWKLDAFPEAFVCSLNNKSEKPEEIGLLLIEKSPAIFSANRSFTVGVDIGTTHTMIYSDDDRGQRAPLNFKNRKLVVTNNSDSQKADLLNFFLPDDEVKPPFLSLYQVFNNDGNRPFLNGHIHHPNSTTDLAENNIYGDLKDDLTLLESFIAQICYQVSAEFFSQGAGSINWRFSYPLNFTPFQIGAFEKICNTNVKNVSGLSGIRADGAVKFYPENNASVEGFRKAEAILHPTNVSTGTGVIFIDIGGGASKISIYQNDQPLKQFSLLYGARDIFLKHLRYNPEVRDILKLPVITDDSRIWIQLEAHLKNRKQSIFNELDNNFKVPSIIKFKRHIIIGLAGLFYYVGMLTRHLINAGVYTDRLPHLYLGGKGSEIFRWLADASNVHHSPMTNLFRTVFKKALGTDSVNDHLAYDGLNFYISQNPKHESAYGLVCSPLINLSSSPNDTSYVIAGEKFMINNLPRSWDQLITPDMANIGLRLPDNLEQIPSFIQTLNNCKEETIGEIVKHNRERDDIIRQEVDGKLNDPNEQKIVFILYLKALLSNFI